MKIVLVCGGTGGHLKPAMMIARYLKEKGHEIQLWLTGREIEKEIIGKEIYYDILTFDSSPVSSGKRGIRIEGIISLVKTLPKVLKVLYKYHPDIVIGMGSYACITPCFVARLKGIPSILHEANAVPGRAISLMAPFADAVMVAFEEAIDKLKFCRRVVYTGLPLDHSIIDNVPLEIPYGTDITFLVMGGSQGASILNEVVPFSLARFASLKSCKIFVIHIAGKRDYNKVCSIYKELSINARVYDFCHEMGRLYATADIAISRAGASSCIELDATGVPAVLIPLPSAVRDHQTANAVVMEKKSKAVILPQEKLDVCSLQLAIENLLKKFENGNKKNIRGSLYIPDSLDRIMNVINSVFSKKELGGNYASV